MRLLTALLCVSIYITAVDLFVVGMRTKQREFPEWLGVWSWVALGIAFAGIVFFQGRRGLSGRVRLLVSMFLTAGALVPWGIGYWG